MCDVTAWYMVAGTSRVAGEHKYVLGTKQNREVTSSLFGPFSVLYYPFFYCVVTLLASQTYETSV